MQSQLAYRPDFLAFGKPNFGDEEIEAVTRVLRSGWVGMGPETLAFEKELSEFIGAPHVVTVNSCTSSLFLSLRALGIGEGDEVICPSLTWCSTANAALYLGATPILCDVDPNTLYVTPETVLPHLTPRTKAVMVVHMGGLPADITALRAALPKHVGIVEDAAHALGARFSDGRQVGASGNLTCFSFYANKNLSTGEGGAIALFDDAIAEHLRSLRQHGLSSDAWKRYIQPQTALAPGVEELGYKMNFMDLLACIGRVQLRRQHEFGQRRLEIALRYLEVLKSELPDVGFQAGLDSANHTRHLFVVKLPVERLPLSRDQVVLELRKRNIGASIHYAPLHHMPLYKSYAASLPATDDLAKRIMTLPISASMTLADAEYVVQSLANLIHS